MNARIRGWGGAAVLLLGVAACSIGEAAEEAPRLQTATVSRGDLDIRAEATGTVEPIRSVEVKSKASGEILRLHVDVGDEAQPGALLAEIDPRDVRNGYAQAKADLDVAVARTEITLAQLERSQELLEAGVIAEQEHETKRLDHANALANQVKAETNFELSELQLEDVTIRAPMKGTIIQKDVEEGQVIQSASGNVSGGTTLFIMANLDEMQVRTLVDETDMGELRAGMQTTVKVEAFPDRTFRGEVEKIEPQAEVQQNVTMFPVIVNLGNRSGLLKPGMNAEVEILIDQAIDVLLVPNTAIVQIQDVGPAALALGLDVESLDLGQLMGAGRGNARFRGAEGDAESPAGRTQEASPQPGGDVQGATGGDPQARMQQLRAQVEAGEISQDSMRAVLQSLRAQGGLGRFPGAAATPGDASVPPRETRPAVVFVLGSDSIPEPRLIRMGLNDWDNTQVVDGLTGDETLVVVGAAQLQARQQEWLNNIRSRTSGSPFGGPGMGGRGPR
jgi:HlyD family secretion protein